MTHPVLLGIHGKAGSGKDTLCLLLQAQAAFIRMAFADPLKKATVALFHFPEERVFEESFKNAQSIYWGMSVRQVYQLLGTEAMRGTFGDDFWVRRWELEYLEHRGRNKAVIVTDVRFENEATAIRSHGGIIVHVERPDRQALDSHEEQHASERGIEQAPEDYVIFNGGTLGELGEQAAGLLEYVGG